jgi:carboxymethylenebutenolidase
MCDQDTYEDAIAYQLKNKELSRRQFGALGLTAGLVAMLPPVANAAEVTESEVEIKTPDGTCDAHFVHPAKGASPAVLVWPDIFGLRPAFRQMGKRLAESGYAVLTINPFYRVKHAPTGASTDFQDPAKRDGLIKMMQGLTAETNVSDAKAFIDWLDKQAAVDKKKKIGTTGYCMGGPLVLRTAATVPNRVGGAATFHGGGLVTDKPDSPHLLIPKAKAQFLIAIAENDDKADKMQPPTRDQLKAAFAANKLKSEVEVYVGSQHGWCPPDSGVYNMELAEKAWARLLATFKTALV